MKSLTLDLVPVLTLLLAFVWGWAWAAMLNTERGLFLARKRTWLTVVVGVGVDLLLMLPLLGLDAWLLACAVVGMSSVGIVHRSIMQEQEADEEAWHHAEEAANRQRKAG